MAALAAGLASLGATAVAAQCYGHGHGHGRYEHHESRGHYEARYSDYRLSYGISETEHHAYGRTGDYATGYGWAPPPWAYGYGYGYGHAPVVTYRIEHGHGWSRRGYGHRWERRAYDHGHDPYDDHRPRAGYRDEYGYNDDRPPRHHGGRYGRDCDCDVYLRDE